MSSPETGNDSAVAKLNRISEDALCIGCGICQSVAGEKAITLEIVESGNYRPIARDGLNDELVKKIYDICPGTRVDGLPKTLIDESANCDPVWGVFQDIYYAWSGEPEVRHMAATGGVLTGLGLYLVESGEVDFLVHAREPNERPAFGERHISRSREEVLVGSGSRYGPTATLIDICEILDQAEAGNESFAFVGTPCDVSALRNYARHDSRVDHLCRYMLTMVCGGFMDAEGARRALGRFNVEYDEIESLRYRGYGCPGPTTIRTRDGSEVQMNYLDYWGEDESSWGLPPRCKICPDGIGDSADIAASDTWDGGSPAWEGQDDDPGFNAVLVRTSRGKGLMNRAISAGYVCRGDTMTPTDMNRVQPHQEAKKRAVWARFQGLERAGNLVPDTRGLRLEALYGENSAAENQAQAAGAESRTREGRFSEPTPKKA